MNVLIGSSGKAKSTKETITTYDSGWVTISAINNTPSSGWHRLTTTFTDYPCIVSITINNGTNVFPDDNPSRIVLTLISSVYYIDVDLTQGLSSSNQFRVRAIIY
jgi:hypothetical protein